jgi:hypothetical protein
MRTRIPKRPSPALAVASLALLVSLGGASFAAVNTVLPPNSVGTPQLKNGAVTAAKLQAGSLLASDFKAGQLPGARWALVRADGAIIAQSGGISLTSHLTGTYVLDFGGPVDRSAIIATPSFASGGLRGEVIAGPCGGPPMGAIGCTLGGDNNHVVVFKTDAANTTLANWPFYVAAIN